MNSESWLPLLHDLADEADRISTGYFRSRNLPVEHKADRSLVTKADLEVESAIRDLMAKRHPELGVFGEEQGDTKGSSGSRLIVDPIDATANFARGLPIYATLLALEVDGEVVVGLVSAPALHERWHAARGHGAWSGDRRLAVSRVAALDGAQIFHGSLAGSEAVPTTAKIPALLAGSWRQRGLGDFYQHMLVAEGCGEIAVDPIVMPWDIAPVQIIVEEAGGRATTIDGTRSIYAGSLVTSNGQLHDTALAAFA
ncbi:MAG: histidinol-phosphatase [Deltaproteobacteria bacterium]|nr:histidinol-phosphatase [Deltaproteobacteria bacterium]